MTTKRRFLIAGVLALAAVSAAGAHLTHGVLWGLTNRFDDAVYYVGGAQRIVGYSHAPYAEALKYVDEAGMVYYAGLKKNRGKLDEYVRTIAFLKDKTYRKWNPQAKIAFWLNAYNALTLKLIVDNHPIKASIAGRLMFPANSIRQIPGAWDKVRFLVMGRKMTLNDIEHNTLRAKFDEPRIHMAMVCAAMGCPPLRNEPFEGVRLSAQLDDQTRKFLAGRAKFRLDRKAATLHVSRIFTWFGDDFVGKYLPPAGFGGGRKKAPRAYLNFMSRYVSADDASWLKTAKYRVKYLKYDWTLNERKTMPKAKLPAASTRPAQPPARGE